MDIYDRIEAALKDKKMTRRQLALRAGLPPSTLNSALNRKSKNISNDMLQKIANTLELDVEYLLGKSPLEKGINKLAEIFIRDEIASVFIKGDMAADWGEIGIINYLFHHPRFSTFTAEMMEIKRISFSQYESSNTNPIFGDNFNDGKELHMYRAINVVAAIIKSYISEMDAYHKENMPNWKAAGLVNKKNHLPTGYYGEDE
jgi:transcriptional regulator with XRE-family HTH domain